MMGSVFAVLINQQEVKQMKKIVALILCLAMVLSVVACGGSKQEPAAPASEPGVDAVAAGAQETTETIETTADTKFKENVIIGLEEDLTLLDPQQSNGTTNLMIRWMTHSTLVDLDLVNGGFLPDLAESWEQTSDTVWVFHLNPNATFQNGDPVKASDVVYTLNRARESSFTSDKVEWIKESRATDDHTVEVELTEPVQDILYYLAYATLSVLDEAAVEADPEKGPNIGSGPYELTDWSYGDHTTLTRYENYWGELPKTKVFTFRIMPEASTRLIALQTGEIDVCMDPAAIELSYIIDDPNLTLLSKASEKTQYITLNVTKAPFDNELVRKAIAYAVNRDDIVAVAVEGRGTVTNTFFSEGFGCYSDVNIYSYDPAKAKELLAEAGYPDGLSITISVSGEEKKLIMYWHPEDGKFYSARLCDLVLADGSKLVLTNEWQDVVVDLEASGFPGMTNAFHFYAFAKCVIWIDEISFSEAVAPVPAAPLDGMTLPETGKAWELPIKDYLAELE